MIESSFQKLKNQLGESTELSDEHRGELTKLVNTLEHEIQDLARTRPDDSSSISGFAQLSTREAIRESKRPDLLKHSLDGLSASVVGLESDHPKITAVVDRMCTLLSNMGI